MLAGELYRALDPELASDHARAQATLFAFNATAPDEDDLRRSLLRELLGHLGEHVVIKPSLRCDYGFNVRIGDRSFLNYDCVLLDCAPITIGADVQIAPGVHVYTATHPIDPELRRSGLEYALPVVIEDGVWIGGGAIIGPGVTIGENSVVGAGSVVVHDLPANVVAVGNPCRVVRGV
jgi:maltose O-acetyltransferase